MTYLTTVAADSPAAFWPCQDTSGSLTDSTGNGHTATASGSGLSYSVQGPGPYEPAWWAKVLSVYGPGGKG